MKIAVFLAISIRTAAFSSPGSNKHLLYILFHNFYTYVPKMKNLAFITFCSVQAFHAGIIQFKDVCNLKQCSL